jgi:hypothetical protein
MLGPVETKYSALVDPAFAGEVRHHGRQERIAIVSARLRKCHDAEAIADRARRRIQVLAVATRQNVWAAQLSAALLVLPVSK